MSGEFKALGSYAGPEIVDSGLVLHLDAGNVNSYPGSGTAWTDLVNRSRTGTLTNGPTYSSTNGGVLVFDGTNDYVTIPNSADFNFGTGDFTVEAWIKLTSSANSYPQIGGTHQGGSGNSGWYYYAATSYASNKQTFGCQTEIQNTQAAISTNVWYHMVASRISNTLTFYQNGVAGASGSYTDNISSSNALLVGNLNSTTNFPATYAFPGQISVFKVYKGKGLTAAGVVQNYNATSGRYLSQRTPNQISGLALWLDASDPDTVYQDSSGTTLATSDSSPVGMWKDRSGNARHATQVSSLSSRPTFKTNVQKNRAAIYFDGSGTWLSNTAYTYSGATTLFVVASNTYDNGYYFDGAGGTIQMGMVRYSSTTLKLWNGLQMLSDANFNLANPSIAESVWNGAASYLGVNGQFSAVGSTNAVSLTGYTVGRTRNGSGAGVMQGNIFEVLLYEGALAPDQRQQVESYLNAKWGVY